MKRQTECVHSGIKTKGYGLVTAIDNSTATRYREFSKVTYPRYFNTSNQDVVCDMLARLECGERAMVFSSGMAAISTALLSMLSHGDHVILCSDIYGGTHKLATTLFPRFGIEFTFVDGQNLDALKKAITAKTKVIYAETPSNPMLTILDLSGIASLAKPFGIICVADNTFASPINQNPLKFGFDVVLHSGTKYLGGHSDLSFGALVTSDYLMTKIWDTAILIGGNLNSNDVYMIERSLKTLSVRVDRQNENAQRVAEFLESHPMVASVFYPGLPSHPKYALAKNQMAGFGGMLSFELKSPDRIEAFISALKMISVAISLGGVETTLSEPVHTSHAKVPVEDRIKMGISDQLMRLSVGIEHYEDIITDLKQALEFNQ